MKPITARDIYRFQTPGGGDFVDFCDSLIRTQSFYSRIPHSAIHTNLRTDVSDGGVDTQNDRPIIINDYGGWLSEKTVWQYKATKNRSLNESSLKKEVNGKNYLRECIKQGFAYRFCVCDSIPPEKIKKCEAFLKKWAQAINPSTPDPRVISADDLAAWANHFPAFVWRYLSIPTDTFLHLDSWGQVIASRTQHFVEIEGWKSIEDAIRTHVDFSQVPPSALISLQGEAGVGKTRLTYEVLSKIPGAKGLVIYLNDESQVKRISTWILNDSSLIAVLVADDCGSASRLFLDESLRPIKNRVRVIAIDNSGERSLGGAPENWLQKMGIENVVKILEINFPLVPKDHVHSYAELSGGFVRIAADMCERDKEISARGQISLSGLVDYYKRRIPDPQEQQHLEALSLVTRIGFKEDVANELQVLCDLTNQDRGKLEATALRFHDVPGFVTIAGRYLYVTPEAIVRIAFERGWKRWADQDPKRFLERISSDLLERFNKRVLKSASQEVQQVVADFFRKTIADMQPSDLANDDLVDRIVVLVEMDPDRNLPTFRNLIESASEEELGKNMGDGRGGGRWGSRRQIVWLLERLVRFPEYFFESETILFKLAMAESEPNIGNNATGIWKQIFRIQLSGTATPFLERLKRLEDRVFSSDQKESDLAITALDDVFDSHVTRQVGPSLIAGKIPPPEWRPQLYRDLYDCYRDRAELLEKMYRNGDRLKNGAQNIALSHIRSILGAGPKEILGFLKAIFDPRILPTNMHNRIQLGLEEFLHFDVEKKNPEGAQRNEYINEVRQWLESLRPTDLVGRVRKVSGTEPWQYSILEKEQDLNEELRTVAGELFQNQETLVKELPWLFSSEARGSGWLGLEIGKLDNEMKLLESVKTAILQSDSLQFARGYISGLVQSFPDSRNVINQIIDQIQEINPKKAFDIYTVEPLATNAITRTFDLVDKKKLTASHFHGFEVGEARRSLSIAQFKGILSRLIKALDENDSSVYRLAIRFIAYELKEEKPGIGKQILDDSEILDMTWKLVESFSDKSGEEAYWWDEIVRSICRFDPKRTASLACKALVQHTPYLKDHAVSILATVAKLDPEAVMAEFGKSLLSPDIGWKYGIDRYTNILASMPQKTIENWVKKHGVKAARQLARHLPMPYLDDGRPTIPPITEFVFKEFPKDDRVFKEFCLGNHSMQMYSGDIAQRHLEEANTARQFLQHTIKRIRDWAQYEISDSEAQAKWWKRHDEEMDFE